MIINAKLIGKRIKEVRTARKMPQMLLAEKCDISDSYLSYIECGRKTPSLEVIIRIARELGLWWCFDYFRNALGLLGTLRLLGRVLSRT